VCHTRAAGQDVDVTELVDGDDVCAYRAFGIADDRGSAGHLHGFAEQFPQPGRAARGDGAAPAWLRKVAYTATSDVEPA